MKHMTGLLGVLLALALVSVLSGVAFAVEGNWADYQQYLISCAENGASTEADARSMTDTIMACETTDDINAASELQVLFDNMGAVNYYSWVGIGMPTEENFSADVSDETSDEPIEIKVLILPKFEVGGMSGDYPGEAQYYYEAYCEGGDEYEITGGTEGSVLYVKDGVALYLVGEGKVNSALTVNNILLDDRFDFSHALILDTGCAGSSADYSVMGDVFVISATVDYDLGHQADSRDMEDSDSETTWFHDEAFDSAACKILDPDLVAQVFDLVKDVKLETTENTRSYMAAAFDGADWAARDPELLLGTAVTGDNYWKGETDHANAVLMTETYGCPDPYAVTEMEDNAIAVALDRLGMLDHLVILRDSVNTDVFMNGATPESLWDPVYDTTADEILTSDDSAESADIFPVAMENNFKVGRVVIEAVLDGTFTVS